MGRALAPEPPPRVPQRRYPPPSRRHALHGSLVGRFVEVQSGDLTPQILRRSLRLASAGAGCLQRSLHLWARREAPFQLLDPAERPLQPVLLLPLRFVTFGV